MARIQLNCQYKLLNRVPPFYFSKYNVIDTNYHDNKDLFIEGPLIYHKRAKILTVLERFKLKYCNIPERVSC